MKLKMSMLAIGIFALLSTSLYIPMTSADEGKTLFYDDFEEGTVNKIWNGTGTLNITQENNNPENHVLHIHSEDSWGYYEEVYLREVKTVSGQKYALKMFNSDIIAVSFDFLTEGVGCQIYLQNNLDNPYNNNGSKYYNTTFSIEISSENLIIHRSIIRNGSWSEISENTGIHILNNTFYTFTFIRNNTNKIISLHVKERGSSNVVYKKEWNEFFENAKIIFDMRTDGKGVYMMDNVKIYEPTSDVGSTHSHQNNFHIDVGMSIVFISLLIFIAYGFINKHWASSMLIAFSSFIVLFVFVLPYLGLTGKGNIIASGIGAIGLTIGKFYLIRNSVTGLFTKNNIRYVLLPIIGILFFMALFYAIFWT